MSHLTVLLLYLIVGQQDAKVSKGLTAKSTVSTPVESRRLNDIDRDILAALKLANLAKTGDEKAAAIYELVDLHREIVADPRFAESEILKEYRIRVASPLIRFKSELLRRQRVAARPTSAGNEAASAQAVRDSLTEQLALTGYTMGGPLQMFFGGQNGRPSKPVQGNTGGAAQFDDGPALVSLIQRTIRPEFWDVNGGPGAIVYWDAWHCLVVRATAEVHEQIGGVSGRLRN